MFPVPRHRRDVPGAAEDRVDRVAENGRNGRNGERIRVRSVTHWASGHEAPAVAYVAFPVVINAQLPSIKVLVTD
jgi:hypothetical protein